MERGLCIYRSCLNLSDTFGIIKGFYLFFFGDKLSASSVLDFAPRGKVGGRASAHGSEACTVWTSSLERGRRRGTIASGLRVVGSKRIYSTLKTRIQNAEIGWIRECCEICTILYKILKKMYRKPSTPNQKHTAVPHDVARHASPILKSFERLRPCGIAAGLQIADIEGQVCNPPLQTTESCASRRSARWNIFAQVAIQLSDGSNRLLCPPTRQSRLSKQFLSLLRGCTIFLSTKLVYLLSLSGFPISLLPNCDEFPFCDAVYSAPFARFFVLLRIELRK